jgi:hypothetical protein
VEFLVQRIDEQARQRAEGRGAEDRHEGDGGDEPRTVHAPGSSPLSLALGFLVLDC